MASRVGWTTTTDEGLNTHDAHPNIHEISLEPNNINTGKEPTLNTFEEDEGGKIPNGMRNPIQNTLHPREYPDKLGKHRSIGLIIPLHRATPAAVYWHSALIATPKSLLDTAW